ncbi:MAG: AI-2E family transporter [Eudoraea sp.]|uniref:AI-2E family transporter n=1 Tax=Eudoraea sp. TaxID=1979955 RepID=UPI003265B36F
MSNSDKNINEISKVTIDVAIRLILLVVTIAICIGIILPFLNPFLWGAIIAVAVSPLYKKITRWIGGREKLAALLLTLFFLLIIIVPSYFLIDSMYDGIHKIGSDLRSGTVIIPPPNESVSDWPLIGEKISEAWQAAYDNLENAFNKYQEQLEEIGITVVGSAVNLSKSMLLFLVSFIIAGILLVFSEPADKTFKKLFTRLMGPSGAKVSELTVITINNVTRGILGVALIQGILAGIGFTLAGVPFAGLWALFILIFAILQIPPVLVTIPIAVYLYSVHDPLVATIWTIVLIIISGADNVLTPLLMGKGAPVPILVIFLGAVGGFMFFGFIGLFSGAIILSIGYKLFIAWLNESEETVKE